MSSSSSSASCSAAGSNPSSNTNSNIESCQTTGAKLAPPKIRVERCRCIRCGAQPELICKLCRQDTIFCKKCARRAKHEHPLKAFRRSDENVLNLRKHLTLSYYEHIVSCTTEICLETCHESRYARTHFHHCDRRPRRLLDIIEDGNVRFDETNCYTCGLFITCMFLHADKCRKRGCGVEWCDEMREIFELGAKKSPVYLVTRDMEDKCRDVHRAEWRKVEERREQKEMHDIIHSV